MLSVVSRDRDVADRGVEPDVHDFFLVLFEGDGGSPFQVSCDAPFSESFFEPVLGDLFAHVCPVSGVESEK